MDTNQDFTIANFRGFGDLKIPKSTRVHTIVGGGGKLFYCISDTSFIFQQLPKFVSVLGHDLKYNYVYVDEKFVNQ